MFRSMSLGLAALLAAGCVTTETSYRPKEPVPPPPGPAHQVHVAWEGRIMKTPDVANQGVELTGIAGRMYLFGADLGHPTPGDGSVVVELYNPEQIDAKGKPQLMERWEIDKSNLKRMLKKD